MCLCPKFAQVMKLDCDVLYPGVGKRISNKGDSAM